MKRTLGMQLFNWFREPILNLTMVDNQNDTLPRNETCTVKISKMILSHDFKCFPLQYPKDIYSNIFSKLNFKDYQKIFSVCKEYLRIVNDPILSKEVIFKEFGFGPLLWNKFFGNTISNEVIDKAFNSLPNDINEILKSPCPAFPKK